MKQTTKSSVGTTETKQAECLATSGNVTSSSEWLSSLEAFKPYIYEGTLTTQGGSVQVPVKVLRDTGSNHSVVVRGAHPQLEKNLTGDSVILKGIGGEEVTPICRLHLSCELVTGNVDFAVKDSLAVEGVCVLLGNEVGGVPFVPCPVVTDKPLRISPTVDLEKKNPHLFPSCVTTRSMKRTMSASENNEDLPAPEESSEGSLRLEELFQESEVSPSVSNEEISQEDEDPVVIEETPSSQRVPEDSSETTEAELADMENSALEVGQVTREKLMKLQKRDTTLADLFFRVVDQEEMQQTSTCYYLKEGLLMRKHRPADIPGNAEWGEYHQILIPYPLRKQVVAVAHESGHMGIRKNVEKIMKYFFWPGLHKDVSRFCRECHTCQIAGKPNETIQKAPLHPIEVRGEPFSKVIIDVVGPLPKTKKGNEYLLTLMCPVTRYPEAIPVRSISAKVIAEKLVEFFSKFGIPEIVQSDRGTNFTSKLFQDVMNLLGVKQQLSTAYHPETQGALERFHQTLKSMLTKYCNESGREWDAGLPLMLFEVRNAYQESMGCSPNEMIFGRDIRGPLKILAENWEENQEEIQGEYVKNLRKRLREIRKFSLENLKISQEKMKRKYDAKTKLRNFSIGQQVLVFLPVKRFPLTNKFQGPYRIIEKLSDRTYVIETPGRRKRQRKIHMNLLKPYFSETKTETVSITQTTSSTEDDDSYELGAENKMNNSSILENLEDKLKHLSVEQSSELSEVIQSFSEIFADVPRRTNLTKHEIKIREDGKPFKMRAYRLSPFHRDVLKKEVEYLLQHGLAEPSSSHYSSPCVLVKKPDGSFRMCTDYRKLNSISVADNYPLPLIDQLLDNIGQAKFVSKIDLLKGYYQIPLDENAKLLSAFITPFGLYQYTVLPFGLMNAPATFQRVMDQLLGSIEGVGVYLDDIVIYSNTWEEHLKILRKVFKKLREAGLTINLQKSEFGKATVQYLGFEVGKGLLAPIDANVEGIRKATPPATRKQLQRFLGMAGFYRRFCPNF
ncbi:uncharacterized protein [Macrobrachium rosenbergii]|uniref:uncharacterized protein n=1 Tax=Macrobrachium rosenbergii TaxID=79674 RepID=UPI0034D7ACD1